MIAQPENDELLLTVKGSEGQYRLLLSASASLPLAYLTSQNKPSPMSAPNFCMLLRKHIGGGRITGTEVTEEHPEGISFGMYHADQYVAPEGQYTTVHAVDGTAWYKQYAVDAVDKSPYMAPDGSIAFNESIVKKLPPAPRRKDKI